MALPWQCRGSWSWLLACRPDSALERRLEEEYWARIGATDLKGLGVWLTRVEEYVDASRTPRTPRLTTLIAGGYVMLYRAYDVTDLSGLPALLEALAWAERAHRLAPNSPNTGSFYYFLRAYRQFGLFDAEGGMRSLETLLGFPAKYGVRGSEGEVVGALALGLLTDPQHAERALSLLADCTTASCLRSSPLAPHKVLGMHLAIAESYAKVGDFAAMYASLARARALATDSGWPFPERIDELEDELMRPSGLVDRWDADNERIGDIRLPLPPSAGVRSCSTCHVGAVVPATTW